MPCGWRTRKRGKGRQPGTKFRSSRGSTTLKAALQITPKPRYRAQWSVASHSNPAKLYIVSQLPTGEFQCSCPHWKFRRPPGGCKHIKEVKQKLAVSAQMTASRTGKAARPRKTPRKKSAARPMVAPKMVAPGGEWKLLTYDKPDGKIVGIHGFPSQAAAFKARDKLSSEQKKKTSEPCILLGKTLLNHYIPFN